MGRGLVEILRVNPKAKIIVASGYSVGGRENAALESGARAFVGKPYDTRELLEKVREILDND